jgi:hypothetical protein
MRAANHANRFRPGIRGLQRPRVVSPVGQRVPASMAQHMRVAAVTFKTATPPASLLSKRAVGANHVIVDRILLGRRGLLSHAVELCLLLVT